MKISPPTLAFQLVLPLCRSYLGNNILKISQMLYLCHVWKMLASCILVFWFIGFFYMPHFPLLWCSLNLRDMDSIVYVSIGTCHSTVTYSLNFGDLSVYVTVFFCCKTKLPVWEMRATLTCGCSNKCLEYSSKLHWFRQMAVIGSSLG